MKLFAQSKPWTGIVDLFNKWTTPVGITRESGLRYLQERVVLTILFTGLVLGLFAYIPSVRLCIKEQLWGVAFFDTAIYAMVFILLFFRRIPFVVRANAIIFSSFLLGLILITVVGPSASGPVWLFTFPVLAGVIIGARSSVYALILNLIALIIIGGLIYLDYPAWKIPSPHTLERWIVITLNFILLNGVAAMSLAMVLRGLQSSLDHEKTLRLSLEHQIDERKQAEDALLESENRLNIIFESAPDSFYINDFEGMFIDGNRAAEELVGYPRKELIGKNFVDVGILSMDQVEKALNALAENINGKSTGPDEYTLKRKNGTTVDVEILAHPVKIGGKNSVLGIARDITERKKAEAALQESEEKYRSMMEAMKEPVYICSPDYRVEYLNPAMIRRIDRDATGEHCFKAIHDLDEKCPWCMHDKIQQNESFEIDIVSPKDNRSYHVSCSPVVHGDGSISRLTVYRDTTDFEKMEAQLHQAQKLESVGRLAGGVAHDYNNALSAIIGFTELVMGREDLPGSLRDDLNEVLKAAGRATDITRQLLAFARKQIIAPKVLDLNENVESMLKMLRRLIGEDIDLAWLPGSGLWLVMLDPSQIDQVLANLCVNARDAIDGVGKITIETKNATFDEDYCADHPGFVPGRFVLLTISDNGCGMDKKILDNIFEPFFTTKDVDKGTGLGMSTVYGIVKQNNGFVNVYSEPGKGATFKIYLPRHKGKAVEIQEASTAKIPPGSGETVLVVEDDLQILKLAKKILDGVGYIVLTAGTPEEALDLARKHAGEIHLLVTDVIMPEMNGRELSEQLQSIYPKLKRVFMSGYTANAIAHHGVLDKGVHFIQKPFSKRDLAISVRKAIES